MSREIFHIKISIISHVWRPPIKYCSYSPSLQISTWIWIAYYLILITNNPVAFKYYLEYPYLKADGSISPPALAPFYSSFSTMSCMPHAGPPQSGSNKPDTSEIPSFATWSSSVWNSIMKYDRMIRKIWHEYICISSLCFSLWYTLNWISTTHPCLSLPFLASLLHSIVPAPWTHRAPQR